MMAFFSTHVSSSRRSFSVGHLVRSQFGNYGDGTSYQDGACVARPMDEYVPCYPMKKSRSHTSVTQAASSQLDAGDDSGYVVTSAPENAVCAVDTDGEPEVCTNGPSDDAPCCCCPPLSQSHLQHCGTSSTVMSSLSGVCSPRNPGHLATQPDTSTRGGRPALTRHNCNQPLPPTSPERPSPFTSAPQVGGTASDLMGAFGVLTPEQWAALQTAVSSDGGASSGSAEGCTAAAGAPAAAAHPSAACASASSPPPSASLEQQQQHHGWEQPGGLTGRAAAPAGPDAGGDVSHRVVSAAIPCGARDCAGGCSAAAAAAEATAAAAAAAGCRGSPGEPFGSRGDRPFGGSASSTASLLAAASSTAAGSGVYDSTDDNVLAGQRGLAIRPRGSPGFASLTLGRTQGSAAPSVPPSQHRAGPTGHARAHLHEAPALGSRPSHVEQGGPSRAAAAEPAADSWGGAGAGEAPGSPLGELVSRSASCFAGSHFAQARNHMLQHGYFSHDPGQASEDSEEFTARVAEMPRAHFRNSIDVGYYHTPAPASQQQHQQQHHQQHQQNKVQAQQQQQQQQQQQVRVQAHQAEVQADPQQRYPQQRSVIPTQPLQQQQHRQQPQEHHHPHYTHHQQQQQQPQQHYPHQLQSQQQLHQQLHQQQQHQPQQHAYQHNQQQQQHSSYHQQSHRTSALALASAPPSYTSYGYRRARSSLAALEQPGYPGASQATACECSSSDDDTEEATRRITAAFRTHTGMTRSSGWGLLGPDTAPTTPTCEGGRRDPWASALGSGGSHLASGSGEAGEGGSAGKDGSGQADADDAGGSLTRKRSSYHLTNSHAAVELFLRLNHARQTMDFVKRQTLLFAGLDKAELGVWEALHLLNELREYEAVLMAEGGEAQPPQDVAALSLLDHAFQTAELCRLHHPDLDWLHLVGLIHGLGKLLAHRRFGSQPQWAICGETFPLGCRFSPHILGSQYFTANPDRRRRLYNTPTGLYGPGCGLLNVVMSWSAPEYLYLVLMLNSAPLPQDAVWVLRHAKFLTLTRPHSCYLPLCSADDLRRLPLLRSFQQLAAFRHVELPEGFALAGEERTAYYSGLVAKYIGEGKLRW